MEHPEYKTGNEMVFIFSRRGLRPVFLSICKEPKTISELAKDLNWDNKECNYPIKRLKDRGYIECINPEVRKGKIYALSKKGEILAEDMRKHKEWCLANNLRQDLYS